MTPKNRQKKKNKWDDIKLRSFYTAKEKSEKGIMWNGILIFAKHISDKGISQNR